MANVFAGLTVPHVLGFLFNWGLHGALSAQVYLYYLAFPDDKTFNKVLVYGIYILETVQAFVLVFIGIYIYSFPAGDWVVSEIVVDEPVEDNTLYEAHWVAIPFLGGLVTFIVQSFYAYRLRILARSWVIVIFIISLAVTQFVVTLVGGSILSLVPYLHDPKFSPGIQYGNISLVVVWVALSIACDVMIASAMTYFLLRSDNGWKSTHSLLVRLVRLAIETGTVTVAVSATCLALLVARIGPLQTNFIYTPISVLGKVYSNAMMANFNQRIQIYNVRNDPQLEITSFDVPSGALCSDSAGTNAEIQENISAT